MPPKSDYWKYFVVQGVLAVCQLPGCPKPKTNEVEDLVDGLLFSDLQDTACLKWWEQKEATYLAKGPAGKALVALAKR